MATFSPLRSRMLRVRVLKRGCAGYMAASGKNNEREALFSGSGFACGVQKSGHPSLGKDVIENILSFSCSRAMTYEQTK